MIQHILITATLILFAIPIHPAIGVPQFSFQPSENSDPSFFKCGVTVPFKGISSFPGLDRYASLNETLFDSTPDTAVAGRTVVDISFAGVGLVNIPGSDILIYEANASEPIAFSVYDNEANNYSSPVEIKTIATGEKNSCGDSVNVGTVDLETFGIPNWASVRSVQIDNGGSPGCCNGSDISGIEFPHGIVQASNVGDGSFMCVLLRMCPSTQ